MSAIMNGERDDLTASTREAPPPSRIPMPTRSLFTTHFREEPEKGGRGGGKPLAVKLVHPPGKLVGVMARTYLGGGSRFVARCELRLPTRE
jgi:hypothetical protein